MSKLFNLKKWLTLEEAADHLASAFAEPVTVPDVLRFALDGHLRLSANFVNHGRANMGTFVHSRDAEFIIAPSNRESFAKTAEWNAQFTEPPPFRGRREQEAWLVSNKDKADKFVLSFRGEYLSEDKVLVFGNKVENISDVWDLSMLGAERLDVQHALHQLTDGVEVKLQCLTGVILLSDDGSTHARLLEHASKNEYMNQDVHYSYDDPKSYYPAGGLPHDAPLVVRPNALSTFIASLDKRSQKPLDSRERATLLCIIGALAGSQRLDLSQPYKAAESVAAMLPGDMKLSTRTIGDHLKSVHDAMDSRKA